VVNQLPVVDDLDYARGRVAALGPRFCATFVKAVDPAEALSRLGAGPSGSFAAALSLGKWTLVLEPDGSVGGDHRVLEAASRGTEALSVLRDVTGSSRFTYAIDGETAVAFDPAYPSAELVWGSQPELLNHLMHALGLHEPDAEDDDSWQDAEAKALVLAQRLTGTRLPADALTTATTTAHLTAPPEQPRRWNPR
jgi:hypothetical protein